MSGTPAEAELLADRAVCEHPAVAEYLAEWRAGRVPLTAALHFALRQLCWLHLLQSQALARKAGPPPAVAGVAGIVCPQCAAPLRTLKTTPRPNGTVARRKGCQFCAYRVTTVERAGH